MAVVASVLAVGPATAVVALPYYTTAVYGYDASVLLSSPDTAMTDGRGSPPGSGATSWVSAAFVRDHGVVANTGGALLDDAAPIETHLARLDHSPANDAMLARLRAAAADRRPLSMADQNFMRHELTEAGLMNRGTVYDQAHEIAGQTHPTHGNYDSEVIKQFAELFNQNWRNYWGIE